MKTTRRILAIVMALAMVLSLCAVAFADQTTAHTITVTTNDSTEAHTYEAYKVFAGIWDETTNTLSNVEWGSGVNGSALLAALKASTDASLKKDGVNIFASCTTARSVAEALATLNSDSAGAKLVAEIISANLTSTKFGPATTDTSTKKATISVNGDGYYFVKDVTANTALSYDTQSDFMLQVVGNVTVESKDSAVSVDKKVGDVNDSTGATVALGVNDTADYDIGDTITYALEGTLPSNYKEFKEFTFTFTDVLSAGLTLNTDSITIKDEQGNNIKSYFTINTSGQTTLTISCADLLAKDATNKYLTNGEKIIVTYTATLNENAVTTVEGNPNTVTITYSTDPNHTGEGTPTNVTPPDAVTVFTYELKVNKVDGNEKPLAGAKFTLYKLIKNTNGDKWEAVGSETEAVATGTAPNVTYVANFKGLDDGIYMLVETTTPGGYNTADPVYFEVEAEHSEAADGTTSVELTVYDGTVSEHPGEAWQDGTMPVYYTFTRTGEHENVTATTTVITTTIVNNAGTVLPSTGGPGRTWIYIIASIMILGAGILLVALTVSKRREEN